MMRIPLEERPRERLIREGVDALSNREVLAIVIGNGTRGVSALDLADLLLETFGGLKQLLDASIEELVTLPGLGQAKAIQIKAAFGLAKRAMTLGQQELPIIRDAKAAFLALQDLFYGKQQETLVVLLLDSKLKAFQREVISIGTLTKVLVHPREVYLPAIRHRAHSVVIAHNHPSGDLEPSDADIRLSKLLEDCGQVLDIPLLDHLIIGNESYCSLKERNFF